MRLLKTFGALFLLPLFVGMDAYAEPEMAPEAALPVSAFHAKMLCSCIFVMEQSEEYCKSYTQIGLPIQNEEIDYNEKRTSALAFGVPATAHYQGDRLGCLLD